MLLIVDIFAQIPLTSNQRGERRGNFHGDSSQVFRRTQGYLLRTKKEVDHVFLEMVKNEELNLF